MIAEARNRKINKIFELDSHVYAFGSTTIVLCMSVFKWAKYYKPKSGIKLHTPQDIETKAPNFVDITFPTFTIQKLYLRFHTNQEHI